MRAHSCFAMFLLATISTLFSAAQQPVGTDDYQGGAVYWVSLTDPACPVTGYLAPAPVSKELRVLYFPMGKDAAIKEPKALILHMVFDDGSGPDDDLTLPFTRRDDGIWSSTVALREQFDWSPRYAVYWAEDSQTKQVDTNEGKYFEVPFCDVYGQRDEQSVRYEAESYAATLRVHGIDRPVNYAKAIDVLDAYIRPPSRGANLISTLWKYKLKLEVDTAETRAALLNEIRKFVTDHSGDGFGLIDALNFVAYQNWVPSETTESLVRAIEAKHPNDNPRAFVLQAKASGEKDKGKRIASLRELVEKYPNSQDADFARQKLFWTLTDLSEREKLCQQLRSKDPEDPFLPLNMASVYVQANRKLPEALALFDQAERLFDANPQNKRARLHYVESTRREMKLHIAEMRADILLRQGNFQGVVATLQPLKNSLTSGSSYYLLGRALEETGDTQAALQAYLEAVVRPSAEDLKHNTALESLWSREKLGSEQDLQQKIDAKLAQHSNDTNYVPKVFRRTAPDFDLVTLIGERLSNPLLRGKKVVLNFWAVWCGPCRAELRPLQDFQTKHPEVVVAAVVIAPKEDKQLEAVVRERQLTTLRIAKANQDLWEKFVVGGVPNTLVIDEAGYLRVQHLGAILDATTYLEADFKAISEAGPAKELANAAK